MRKALITYHLVNILHLIFYLVIFLALIDAFHMGNLMKEYVYYVIGIYFVSYLGLNFYARHADGGKPNPITRIALSNWLHAGSIAVFAISFFLYFRVDQNYVYIMLVSFPMDIFAVVVAYRAFPVNLKSEKNTLDSFDKSN